MTLGYGRRYGQFGRQPATPARPRLRVTPYRQAAAPPPPAAAADWYSRVTDWPMYLNDSLGDCVFAEIGHQIGSASAYASAEVLLTDADMVTAYSRVTGYNGTPATDRGAIIQDALGDWRRNGVGGRKCLAFAEADAADLTEIRQCVAVFGSMDVGLRIYDGDLQAFNNHQPWDTSYPRGALAGGHCAELAGYDPAGGTLITWAAAQPFTWAWWADRVDEAWLVILSEWLEAGGSSPSGFDLHGLGQRMSDLTGDPNPFPVPAPPAPQPSPPPPPPVADPDVAYAGDPKLTAWARRIPSTYAKRQYTAWKAAKGL